MLGITEKYKEIKQWCEGITQYMRQNGINNISVGISDLEKVSFCDFHLLTNDGKHQAFKYLFPLNKECDTTDTQAHYQHANTEKVIIQIPENALEDNNVNTHASTVTNETISEPKIDLTSEQAVDNQNNIKESSLSNIDTISTDKKDAVINNDSSKTEDVEVKENHVHISLEQSKQTKQEITEESNTCDNSNNAENEELEINKDTVLTEKYQDDTEREKSDECVTESSIEQTKVFNEYSPFDDESSAEDSNIIENDVHKDQIGFDNLSNIEENNVDNSVTENVNEMVNQPLQEDNEEISQENLQCNIKNTESNEIVDTDSNDNTSETVEKSLQENIQEIPQENIENSSEDIEAEDEYIPCDEQIGKSIFNIDISVQQQKSTLEQKDECSDTNKDKEIQSNISMKEIFIKNVVSIIKVQPKESIVETVKCMYDSSESESETQSNNEMPYDEQYIFDEYFDDEPSEARYGCMTEKEIEDFNKFMQEQEYEFEFA